MITAREIDELHSISWVGKKLKVLNAKGSTAIKENDIVELVGFNAYAVYKKISPNEEWHSFCLADPVELLEERGLW